MLCLTLTTKNIQLPPTIDYLFSHNYFHTKFLKSDLPKLRSELISGLANLGIAPIMSIKLGSEYERTHMLLEACYMELK